MLKTCVLAGSLLLILILPTSHAKRWFYYSSHYFIIIIIFAIIIVIFIYIIIIITILACGQNLILLLHSMFILSRQSYQLNIIVCQSNHVQPLWRFHSKLCTCESSFSAPQQWRGAGCCFCVYRPPSIIFLLLLWFLQVKVGDLIYFLEDPALIPDMSSHVMLRDQQYVKIRRSKWLLLMLLFRRALKSTFPSTDDRAIISRFEQFATQTLISNYTWTWCVLIVWPTMLIGSLRSHRRRKPQPKRRWI